MSERSYRVEGMTCDHCVNAVSTEVAKVPGVRAVDVDLGSGSVRVSGDQVDDGAVRQAITMAGYEVVAA